MSRPTYSQQRLSGMETAYAPQQTFAHVGPTIRPGPEAVVRSNFFAARNRNGIVNTIQDNAETQTGEPLNERQMDILEKVVDHYMKEVFSVQSGKPLAFLNKETLDAASRQFATSMRRVAAAPAAPAARGGGQKQKQPQPQQQLVQDDGLFQDTGSRFEQLQTERNDLHKKSMPTPPDFSLPLSDDGPSAMELFERARTFRESEAAAVPTQDAQQRVLFSPAETLPPRVMESGANDLYPAMLERTNPEASPNLAQPTYSQPGRQTLQQQVIIPQDDVLSYREIESNLVLYSADRDWYNNTTENRYNFSVMFDPANNRNTFGLSPTSYKKFTNITRIELVKVILPSENLDPFLYRDLSANTNEADIMANVLNFPQVIVRISELNSNIYGTDNYLDNAFGIVQYDANWFSDTGSYAGQLTSKGYLCMIPKFLVCKKEYKPTPLSTLQKLTIQLERPNGALLSSVMDTLSISTAYMSTQLNAASAFYDAAAPAQYIAIKTSTYFPYLSFNVGDRVQFKGTTMTSSSSLGMQTDFLTFLNRDEGHLVAGIGYEGGSANTIVRSSPYNSAGYCNFIVIYSKPANFASGATGASYFGGGAADINITTIPTGKFINLNRQTQLVLRIITRELDPTTRVRPDNL